MNREIKFRAYENLNARGRMFCWDEIKTDFQTYLNCKDTFVMPYINRNDINNLEIYEDDVVDVQDGADGLISEMKAGRYKVVYSQVDCAFILEQIDGKNGIAFDESMSLTIVGNIHDNPELLNQ